jgi:hypothetical protein
MQALPHFGQDTPACGTRQPGIVAFRVIRLSGVTCAGTLVVCSVWMLCSRVALQDPVLWAW